MFARLAHLEEGTAEYSRVRGRLVEVNMALVRHAARRFRRRAGEKAGVLQAGTVGLIKAVTRFDPDGGTLFVAYAMPRIVGEMRRHFREKARGAGVPRWVWQLCLDITQGTDRFTADLGRALVSPSAPRTTPSRVRKRRRPDLPRR